VKDLVDINSHRWEIKERNQKGGGKRKKGGARSDEGGGR
jgi:hypothetical protein